MAWRGRGHGRHIRRRGVDAMYDNDYEIKGKLIDYYYKKDDRNQLMSHHIKQRWVLMEMKHDNYYRLDGYIDWDGEPWYYENRYDQYCDLEPHFHKSQSIRMDIIKKNYQLVTPPRDLCLPDIVI